MIEPSRPNEGFWHDSQLHVILLCKDNSSTTRSCEILVSFFLLLDINRISDPFSCIRLENSNLVDVPMIRQMTIFVSDSDLFLIWRCTLACLMLLEMSSWLGRIVLWLSCGNPRIRRQHSKIKDNSCRSEKLDLSIGRSINQWKDAHQESKVW